MATQKLAFVNLDLSFSITHVLFDDVTGAVTAGIPAGETVQFVHASDIIFEDANWRVRVVPSSPYAVAFSKSGGCSTSFTSSAQTTDDGTSNGSITSTDVNAGTRTLYSITNAITPITQVANPVFINLPAGDYMLIVGNISSPTCRDYALITIYESLVAAINAHSETSEGAGDGSIESTVTKGSGSYRVDYNWDVTFANFSGTNPVSVSRGSLSVGAYDLTITDLLSGDTLDFDFTIEAPLIETTKNTIFFIPKTQSFEFVHEVVPDGCTVLETLDNVRYCKQAFPYVDKKNYYQKVVKSCDFNVVQFQSNYESHEVKLFKYSNDLEIASSFVVIRKVNNSVVRTTYDITITDHGAGQSRVYFETAELPLDLSSGDSFRIEDNADGFDGNYEIQSIAVDDVLLKKYLVINLNYGIVPPSSLGTGLFYTEYVPFDIYEVVINLSAVDDGIYYLKIRAFTGAEEATPGYSEPIKIADEFPDTNLIQASNTDNAFDIDYSTGIVHRLRVESRLLKRIPAGKKDVTRNTTGELIKLRAQKQRKVQFEFFQLPPYLHEKLSVIFDLDTVLINGVAFQTEEDYDKPGYFTRAGLSGSSIIVEQVGWFRTYNSNQFPSTELETSGVSDTDMVNNWNSRGEYDASVDTFPASGGSGSGGAIKAFNTWRVIVAGDLGTIDPIHANVGSILVALEDGPGQDETKWRILA